MAQSNTRLEQTFIIKSRWVGLFQEVACVFFVLFCRQLATKYDIGQSLLSTLGLQYAERLLWNFCQMMPKIIIRTVHLAARNVDAVRSFVYLTYRIPYIQKGTVHQSIFTVNVLCDQSKNINPKNIKCLHTSSSVVIQVLQKPKIPNWCENTSLTCFYKLKSLL